MTRLALVHTPPPDDLDPIDAVLAAAVAWDAANTPLPPAGTVHPDLRSRRVLEARARERQSAAAQLHAAVATLLQATDTDPDPEGGPVRRWLVAHGLVTAGDWVAALLLVAGFAGYFAWLAWMAAR